jgi:hypothetical protein
MRFQPLWITGSENTIFMPRKCDTIKTKEAKTVDVYRLKMKVGPHEFESEGDRDSVDRQFSQWREMIEREIVPALKASGNGEGRGSTTPAGIERTSEELSRVFLVDDRRELVTLRSLPTGEGRYGEGIVLVLFGFRRLRDQDEVLVTALKGSLEASGSSPARIDRIAAPLIREGLVLKGGKAKGSKYRLTTRGVARAEELTEEILSQLS